MDIGEAQLADFAEAFARLGGEAVSEDEAQALLLSVFEAPNLPLWRLAEVLAQERVVGALSDNPAFVQAVFPPGARLAPIIFSSDIGAVKPSAAAFVAAETRLGCAAGDILLIDDSPTNIAAARARGWDAIRFRANDALVAELTLRGLP
jgi:HAD superfamily hydrolase (TIGR01509 family)